MANGMVRIILATTTALALGAGTAKAAVIKAGDYEAGTFFDTSQIGLGPGQYLFSIAVSTPLDFVDGFAEKQTVTNFYCVDPDIGPDEFYCGGNDVPTQPLWDQVTPTLFQASITVNPDQDVPFPAGLIVRYTEQDDCCRFQFGWDASAAGRYVLSFQAVPEPAVWATMVGGFGLVGEGARRRARAVRPATS